MLENANMYGMIYEPVRRFPVAMLGWLKGKNEGGM